MKKKILGRKFKRDKNERKALFKGLMSSLVLHDRIETTEEKAKAIKPIVEKLVTKAKKGGNQSLLIVKDNLAPNAYDILVKNVAPRFKDRNGGYTRIIRLGERLGDKAQMVILEWVEKAPLPTETKVKKLVAKEKKKKTTSTKEIKSKAKPKTIKK